MSRLLVIVPDRLSEILLKGEIQPGYYNPGEMFDEVHILMMNDDRPETDRLRRMVGQAKLFIHNFPDDLNLVNRRPEWLRGVYLRRWARGGIELARKIRPDLVRCHGADWNAYLASRIKAALGIPYVVSLHTNPDVSPFRRVLTGKLTREQERHNAFYDYIERVALGHADLVMPVYKSILPYLQRLGIRERVEVCYNVTNRERLRQKPGYDLHQPARVICVGRLYGEKNPTQIIRAIAQLPGVQLTIVGDGPLRPELEQLARDLRVADRVIFRPSVMNDELCELLAQQDIFAVHTQAWEINKSVLEALLTGLPVVINRRVGEPVPELDGDFVVQVPDTQEAYREALNRLLTDDAARASLGRRALAHSRSLWAPELAEARYVEIYRRFVPSA